MGILEHAVEGLLFARGAFKGELDPVGRITATIVGQPDRPPIFAQMHDHPMRLCGVPALKMYTDARTFFNSVLAVTAYYGLDFALMAPDIYNIEAEALGQKLIYGEDSMPTIDFREPLIKEPADLLKLKSPDPYHDGRMPFMLELGKLCSEQLGLAQAAFCAPFSLAVGIRSYPLLMRDLRTNPSFAHDLFTFLVDEILLPYLKVQKKECGAFLGLGADAWAAFPNITPRIAEEWVVPYAQRLTRGAMEFGVLAYCAGTLDYCEERPELFNPDTVRACFDTAAKTLGAPLPFLGMGRWQDYDLSVVQQYALEKGGAAGKLPILAGFNARLLRDGPAEAIVEVVKRYIDVLARQGRFFMFLANIPADAPPEHVHTAVAATHTFGRYPIAPDLDRIEFRPPQRESFAEFAARLAAQAG